MRGEKQNKARDQAFAILRSMTADVIERHFPPGETLTDDNRDFLQGIIVQAVVLAKARYYIGLSQWDKAAAEYAKADWSRPLEDDTFAYACLFLIRRDSEAYNRFCKDMIQRAGEMEDPEAYVLARMCAIGRTTPVDPVRVLQWAKQDIAGSQNPWDFHVLGLAQYRAGQFDQALQSFTGMPTIKIVEISRTSNGSGWPWFTNVWATLTKPGNVWTRASIGSCK